MARLSFLNLEPINQLQRQTGGSANPLGRLAAGDIVRAQVTRDLGNGLFQLNFRGTQITASSPAGLSPGQILTLQVTTNPEGQPALHILTLTEGALAGTASGQNLLDIDNQQLADLLARTPILAADEDPNLPLGADRDTRPPLAALTPETAELLRPDGPVARLLASRPELAPRIQELLDSIVNRPPGLGSRLSQLAEQVGAFSKGDVRAPIPQTASAIVNQFVTRELFDQPAALARTLSQRLGALAHSLEGAVAQRAFALETALQTNAEPAIGRALEPAGNQLANVPVARQDVQDAGAREFQREAVPHRDLTTEHPRAESATPTEAKSLQAFIHGAFEGDLKGQLLELRAQLESLRSQAAVPRFVESAIVQTDLVLDQITAQQVRNVEGLNQFLHVELPVDPRTGVEEARLQVFYRRRSGSSAAPSAAEPFTVAIFLNLQKLGDVLAVVGSVDDALTVGFTVEQSSAAQLLEASADHLRTALGAVGTRGATVTIRQQPIARPDEAKSGGEVWKAFLDAGPSTKNQGDRLDARV